MIVLSSSDNRPTWRTRVTNLLSPMTFHPVKRRRNSQGIFFYENAVIVYLLSHEDEIINACKWPALLLFLFCFVFLLCEIYDYCSHHSSAILCFFAIKPSQKILEKIDHSSLPIGSWFVKSLYTLQAVLGRTQTYPVRCQ